MADYQPIDASPVKRFFVEMLTRDITVEDAILDLLDNCVDGILRSFPHLPDGEKPYEGYWANIIVNKDQFQIEDNCGGIPWSEHDRAFRMGRPNNNNHEQKEETLSVGVYGIGMKRAIFKMGSEALIWTQNGEHNYEVEISPDWIASENNWNLNVKEGKERRDKDGTFLIVQNLYPDVSEQFAAERFEKNLLDKIGNHYAVIISKGFNVHVNNFLAKPKPIVFRFNSKVNEDGTEVKPFMYKHNEDGVQIFLAVGLYEPIPDSENTLAEQEVVRYSSDNAGWTVICNDRVVLYCNRDELTGWGTAGVPRYHTQFIAITGVVEFRGDPRKLPTNTTKRGLDVGSALYQRTLDKMREGTQIFTNFTNKWKTREEEAKKVVSPVPSVNYSDLKKESGSLTFYPVRVGLQGEQYKPKLPLPPDNSSLARISYWKEKDDIIKLADVLLPDIEGLNEQNIRRRIGEESFDFAYKSLLKISQ